MTHSMHYRKIQHYTISHSVDHEVQLSNEFKTQKYSIIQLKKKSKFLYIFVFSSAIQQYNIIIIILELLYILSNC